MESALDILAGLALGTGLDHQGPGIGILGPPSSPNGGGPSGVNHDSFSGDREQFVLESRGAFIVSYVHKPLFESVPFPRIYVPPILSVYILVDILLNSMFRNCRTRFLHLQQP